MIVIPGVLISIITFPGVIMHELSLQIFCRLRRVPVYEVEYFQFKNPCGYVAHEPSENPLTIFLITMGPFIFNTLVGALMLLPASVVMSEFGFLHGLRYGNVDGDTIMRMLPTLLAFWLGASILMHAFPSTGDAKILVANILRNKNVNIFVRVLVAPFVGFAYLGAYGSIVWLDLGYAILVAFMLPRFIGLFF